MGFHFSVSLKFAPFPTVQSKEISNERWGPMAGVGGREREAKGPSLKQSSVDRWVGATSNVRSSDLDHCIKPPPNGDQKQSSVDGVEPQVPDDQQSET